MAKGIDGPHDYRDAIEMQDPSEPKSSSTGPMNQGKQGPENQGSFSSSDFMTAHMEARGQGYDQWGMYTAPTMAGHLGSSPMDSSDQDGQAYTPGAPTMVTHVDGKNCCAAYDYPDAPGGGLGRS